VPHLVGRRRAGIGEGGVMSSATQSLHIRLGGRVQGVGFRPFVYRLSQRLGLSGWVRNRSGNVEICAQGDAAALSAFQSALIRDAPPLARPCILSCVTDEPSVRDGFEIRPSDDNDAPDAHVPPDCFLCEDCRRELNDPADRRYRYPFINCTQCGPRYTLIERLPYDRANTAMAPFDLCVDCRREYDDPLNRRFHAEPLACPVCGPRLLFTSRAGSIDHTEQALKACVAAIDHGWIVAVKGVGGCHLLCDATNDLAVARLRKRKPRPHKPLAVMFPLDDAVVLLDRAVYRSTEAERVLFDPTRPIVLMPKRASGNLSDLIAPGLDEIGVMLPYSPLHYLLLRELQRPVVATSANLSGEPVLTSNEEVERRLGHVADAFLHHNRRIVRPADDSVYRIVADRARPLRLGRGDAPLELTLERALHEPTLAVGGHLKNTVALAWGKRVIVSPHIGDLGSARGMDVFERLIGDLQALYGVRAQRVVTDAHPGYASRRWAERSGLPVHGVFHHRAHASALAGEHPDVRRWLTFTWDAVGYGEDGTLWGGEAFLGRPGAWRRIATMRRFRVPGGDRAALQPWRSACALIWETGNVWDVAPPGAKLLEEAWRRSLNAPITSSVGRMFDAAAAIVQSSYYTSFDGQGPMQLESLAHRDTQALETVVLPSQKNRDGLWETDWAPLVPYLMNTDLPPGERAAVFHRSLAQALTEIVRYVGEETGNLTVGLSGGVFQNRLLTEDVCARLARRGIPVRLAQTIPCNDAGLSFGQIIEVQAQDNYS
jgi:hydrogenase maturation protein HypF